MKGRDVAKKLSLHCRDNWGAHFKEIIPFKDALQRDFYAGMCRIERRSVRTLRDRYLEKDLEDAILREIESLLLELGQSGIHVADYLTALSPRELLQQKLHAAIELSRARLDRKGEDDG